MTTKHAISDGVPVYSACAVTTPRIRTGMTFYCEPARTHLLRAREALTHVRERNPAHTLHAIDLLLGDAIDRCGLRAYNPRDPEMRTPTHPAFREALPLASGALSRLLVHTERGGDDQSTARAPDLPLDQRLVRLFASRNAERVRAKVYEAAGRLVEAAPLVRGWKKVAIDDWDHTVSDLGYVIHVVVWLASQRSTVTTP